MSGSPVSQTARLFRPARPGPCAAPPATRSKTWGEIWGETPAQEG